MFRHAQRHDEKVIVITKSGNTRKGAHSNGIVFLAVLPLAMGLSGCMSFDFFDSRADATVTSSVSPKKSPDAVSDEATVRNAVTSADLNRLGTSSLPWANTSTGSAGVVTSVSENRINGTVCRSFVTTRHAYDGIANFNGDACLDGSGQWQLVRFSRQN